MVVGKMESLPLEVAVELAKAGLDGVHSKGIQSRLERVDVPQIQQLLLKELAGDKQ